MTSIFSRLHPRIQEGIAHRLGWGGLRPVQELAGEALLDGKNAIILAPTAGGKTEAALLPLLSGLAAEPPAGVAVLYVAPLRALLNNQAPRLELLASLAGARAFTWHGDASPGEKRRFLREPAEVLLTTPESLEVMLLSPRVPVRRLMAGLRAVVIDEIHAMAGQDRGGHLMSVLERLAHLAGRDLQRVGLSATVGNPGEILAWLQGSSQRPGAVIDPPKEPAKRALRVVLCDSEEALAASASSLARRGKSLIFCNSRSTTEAVARQVQAAGVQTFTHHSAISAEEREAAERAFHGDSSACIACTSTLELGIDVGDLDRVLQIDAPETVGAFLQRLGRTGRRPGTIATGVFLCQELDMALLAMALINLARRGEVEPARLDRRRWPVLVHQVLAMSLASGGVQPDTARGILRRVPDLSGVTDEEYDAVIQHMLAEDFLALIGGVLVMGEAAEKAYGRRNFQAMYAVFSSPRPYTVATLGGRELGWLEQDFVDRLAVGSGFLLTGRPWQVVLVHHAERRIAVQPASRGIEPTWSGSGPRMVGPAACQEIRRILASSEEPPWLHPGVLPALRERREEMAPVLAQPSGMIWEPGDIRWWTFAGGKVNATLRLALRQMGDWKVSADSFHVRIRAEGPVHRELLAARQRLRDPAFWRDETFWAAVRAGLPAWRLSKFQPALPPWAQQEMIASSLLDLDGAAAFLGAS